MLKPPETMSSDEILAELAAQGYELPRAPIARVDLVTTIREAARNGCLVWTDRHVVSVLPGYRFCDSP